MNSKNKKSQVSDVEINPLEFEGLAGFEEIDSYSIVRKREGRRIFDINKTKDLKKAKPKPEKHKIQKQNNRNPESKDAKPKPNVPTTKKLPDFNHSKSPKRGRETDDIAPHAKKMMTSEVDVDAWKSIFTPEKVIESLKSLGFKEPSAIQRLSIPAAIKGRRDIIGAAETGSGKTLAFIIPIIHGILREKEGERKMEEEKNETPDEEEGAAQSEESSDSEEGTSEEEEVGGACVKVVNNVKFDFPTYDTGMDMTQRKLRALIVTPTRELAVQIKKHTDAVLPKTDIKCAVVIGGLSQEKQERVLSKGPEIVIGTPGRLWELIKQGNPHLCQLSEIRFLAIDETDRMLEKGHFEELQDLLDLINKDSSAKKRRQNFVFSATLMLTHEPPKRSDPKKKVITLSKENKLQNLMRLIGIREKPKIVDITRKFGTAEMLSETKILCDKDEKDTYLFYFIRRFPGRTLIFCNSINCVKRLSNLLNLLQCKPQVLHASKQQKQRLTSLERFASNRVSALLATDVAARGIDIPGVDHIIHYEVPRVAETYVHRSGRTARAEQEGLSVLLVDSSEVQKYHKLCRTLNRSSDLPSFPVEEEGLRGVKEMVELAREVEQMEYRMKKNSDSDWLQKMAAEAGLESDRSSDEDEDQATFDMDRKKTNTDIEIKKARLSALLSGHSATKTSFRGRYPTTTGKLVIPNSFLFKKHSNVSEGAVALVKQGKRKRKRASLKTKLK